MENSMEFRLMKLKVASEIVRSSQAIVAFSRAFYLEEVLLDKIFSEVKDARDEILIVDDRINTLLKSAHLEDNIVTETNVRLLCSNVQSKLDEANQLIQEYEKRVLQARARRQAKSEVLQELSSQSILCKFESLSLEQLQKVQIPEFSCFINDSDFGLLEKLNEDWGVSRTLLLSDLHEYRCQINELAQKDASSFRPISDANCTCYTNHNSIPSTAENSFDCSPHAEISLDEIGKTFANRSGSVLKKFSTLLRSGKKAKKSFSTTSVPGATNA